MNLAAQRRLRSEPGAQAPGQCRKSRHSRVAATSVETWSFVRPQFRYLGEAKLDLFMSDAYCSQLAFEFPLPAGPPPLIIRTCRHIKDGGAFCEAAALGGRAYCRAHLSFRTRYRKMARACRRAGRLKLPPLTHMRGVQAGITQVRVAQAAGHIDAIRARLLRRALRLMAANFSFLTRSQAPQGAEMRHQYEKDKSKQVYHIPINHSKSMASDINTS